MATPLTNSGKTVSPKNTGQISISIASIFHTLFPIEVTQVVEQRGVGETAPIALRTETSVMQLGTMNSATMGRYS